MFNKSPPPFPGANFDTNGFYNNPAGVNPYPQPQGIGVAFWDQQPFPLTFEATTIDEDPYVSKSRWTSPVYDLQPWLRGMQNQKLSNAIPIWRQGLGAAGRLWVQLTNLGPVFALGQYNSQINGLTVLGYAEAHINSEPDIQRVTAKEDITTQIVGPDLPSSIYTVFPTGDGYPVRWWRYVLEFWYTKLPRDQQATGPDFTSPITLTASYY